MAALVLVLTSVKLLPLIVVVSSGLLKLAVTTALAATPVALAAGAVEVTVSGAAIVVKLQLTAAASAPPSEPLTELATVAVYWVLLARAAVGVSVALVEPAV